MGEDGKAALIAAFDRMGVNDKMVRAGIAAIAAGESGFAPKTETGYARTANDRIRLIFGERVPDDDGELNQLKADERLFFDRVYGGRYGNVEGTDDGYVYRGRGFLQHTFKDNYAELEAAVSRPLVEHPDMVNDVQIAAECAVAYISKRWDGEDFASMLKCVGYNIGDIAATKNAAFNAFMASGEFGGAESA